MKSLAGLIAGNAALRQPAKTIVPHLPRFMPGGRIGRVPLSFDVLISERAASARVSRVVAKRLTNEFHRQRDLVRPRRLLCQFEQSLGIAGTNFHELRTPHPQRRRLIAGGDFGRLRGIKQQ